MLAETGMTELVMGFPLFNGFAGCHAQWAGGALYKEYAVTAAYALSLSKKLIVGANILYQGAVAQGFDRSSFIQGGLGVLFKTTPAVSIGLRVQSTIMGGSKNASHAEGRFFMAWGMGCDINKQVHLMFEISYDQDFPVICTGALIYDITDRFDIRMAARTDTRSGFLSAGFQTGKFRLCVSGSYQPVLGYTPAAAILYQSNQPAS